MTINKFYNNQETSRHNRFQYRPFDSRRIRRTVPRCCSGTAGCGVTGRATDMPHSDAFPSSLDAVNERRRHPDASTPPGHAAMRGKPGTRAVLRLRNLMYQGFPVAANIRIFFINGIIKAGILSRIPIRKRKHPSETGFASIGAVPAPCPARRACRSSGGLHRQPQHVPTTKKGPFR